jgi:hypothetical protein
MLALSRFAAQSLVSRQCRNSGILGFVAHWQNCRRPIAVNAYIAMFLAMAPCLPDPIGMAYAIIRLRQGGHGNHETLISNLAKHGKKRETGDL